LISRCKLARLDGSETASIDRLTAKPEKFTKGLSGFRGYLHDFHGRDHWFSHQAQRELAYCLQFVNSADRSGDLWAVLATALSAIVNIYSNQDSETRYVRRGKNHLPGELTRAFILKLTKIMEALRGRGSLGKSRSTLLLGDLRATPPIASNSVDVVITSPPYANTMDYYLYHKQRMNILGFDFKLVQSQEIGSRHQFSSRKDSVVEWNRDYRIGLGEVLRMLKKGGSAWIVIGDSRIAGAKVDGAELTLESARGLGYEAELVASEPMHSRSRMFSASFQSPGKSEHVVLIHG
jgi:site-specific DNA-methyltransferase (cytosine-N4-specific)